MRELMKHKPIEKIRVAKIRKAAEHHGPPAIFCAMLLLSLAACRMRKPGDPAKQLRRSASIGTRSGAAGDSFGKTQETRMKVVSAACCSTSSLQTSSPFPSREKEPVPFSYTTSSVLLSSDSKVMMVCLASV